MKYILLLLVIVSSLNFTLISSSQIPNITDENEILNLCFNEKLDSTSFPFPSSHTKRHDTVFKFLRQGLNVPVNVPVVNNDQLGIKLNRKFAALSVLSFPEPKTFHFSRSGSGSISTHSSSRPSDSSFSAMNPLVLAPQFEDKAKYVIAIPIVQQFAAIIPSDVYGIHHGITSAIGPMISSVNNPFEFMLVLTKKALPVVDASYVMIYAPSSSPDMVRDTEAQALIASLITALDALPEKLAILSSLFNDNHEFRHAVLATQFRFHDSNTILITILLKKEYQQVQAFRSILSKFTYS